MRYALLSDVHNRRLRLEAALADARARGADRIISLGDVGGDECVELLRAAGALTVFGNYEVSGWRSLAGEHRTWVSSWPPMLTEDHFIAVHAVPWWPSGLETIDQFAHWLDVTGSRWQALFPYMTEDENHLMRAAAYLEDVGRSVVFHGHTHRQTAWRFTSSGTPKRIRSRTVRVDRAYRYVVGVGSVGIPEGGGWAAYTLYDEATTRIDLIRLSRRSSYP